MTNRLKLKRTPEEEAQHRLGKERRREKRKRKQDDYATRKSGPSSSKRAHIEEQEEGPPRKWASSDEDEMEYGPQPAPTSSHIPPPRSYAHKPDYDTLKAEIEEKVFREKMFEAMGDEERLDSVEAQFNDFAQVPDRWRTSSSTSSMGAGKAKTRINYFEDDGLLKLDPKYMDDEEYAEWIRAGMYRKTHAEEYVEQQRKKVAQATRRAEEKARKVEMARLEKEAEEERRRKKLERESRRLDYAREEYNARWTALLAIPGEGDAGVSNAQVLIFDDIPWPIATAYRSKPDKRCSELPEQPACRPINVDDLTPEAVSSFLLPVLGAPDVPNLDHGVKKERKDKLRETFLRFHPDKFEGRFMKRFKEEDKEKVLQAIGQVSRVLNSLMGNGD